MQCHDWKPSRLPKPPPPRPWSKLILSHGDCQGFLTTTTTSECTTSLPARDDPVPSHRAVLCLDLEYPYLETVNSCSNCKDNVTVIENGKESLLLRVPIFRFGETIPWEVVCHLRCPPCHPFQTSRLPILSPIFPLQEIGTTGWSSPKSSRYLGNNLNRMKDTDHFCASSAQL